MLSVLVVLFLLLVFSHLPRVYCCTPPHPTSLWLLQARDCDFVFLAVGGDFAKEYAEQLTEGVSRVVILEDFSKDANMVVVHLRTGAPVNHNTDKQRVVVRCVFFVVVAAERYAL